MAQWSKEIFARNLRKYMEGMGKTQRDMAAIVGVSTATFSEWINAKKFPRIDKIEMLANYFGIQKSDLIEDKKPSAESSEELLDKEIIERLMSLSPEELEKVDAFVQGILAMR